MLLCLLLHHQGEPCLFERKGAPTSRRRRRRPGARRPPSTEEEEEEEERRRGGRQQQQHAAITRHEASRHTQKKKSQAKGCTWRRSHDHQRTSTIAAYSLLSTHDHGCARTPRAHPATYARAAAQPGHATCCLFTLFNDPQNTKKSGNSPPHGTHQYTYYTQRSYTSRWI
jgi:hypothetical protein